ncbi:hypothetical protein ACBV55_17105 [Franconibacter pulveris]
MIDLHELTIICVGDGMAWSIDAGCQKLVGGERKISGSHNLCGGSLGSNFCTREIKKLHCAKNRKSLRKPQVRRTAKMRLQPVSKLGFILRKIGYYLIQKDSLFWVVRRKKAEQNISPPAK